MRSGPPRTSCARRRNVVASWVDPNRVSAAHARDVKARLELMERNNGAFDDRSVASRIAAGRQGRAVALLGKRKMARARIADPVA
jgi:hypothetical protein